MRTPEQARLPEFVAEDELLWSDFAAEDRRAFVVGNSAVYGLRCS